MQKKRKVANAGAELSLKRLCYAKKKEEKEEEEKSRMDTALTV